MRIAITAGGTGGHIFPALSVAKAIKEQDSNSEIIWFGTERNREREVCESNTIPIVMLSVSGINRRKPLSAIMAIIKMIMAVVKMYLEFSKNPVDKVIAFGGYVCAPVLIAAKIKNIPYYLQEQNSVPGMVNRKMSNYAVITYLGLPLSTGYSLKSKTKLTGNPVRTIQNYSKFIFPDGIKKGIKTLLVCGGSQGAASMNRELIDPVKKILDMGYQVIWQTGKIGYIEVDEAMDKLENIYLFETLNDLYPYYSISNILIGRSGASTLAEAALFALPVILVPLPWSAEDHQRKNAKLVEKQGWAIVTEQTKNCSEDVLDAVLLLDNDNEKYNKMKKMAKENSPENSASIIAEQLLEPVVR